MKLHPPIIEIPKDNPYSRDLFGLKEFGDSLATLFKNVEDDIVLCIDAPWGDGKSTFAKMWMADLNMQGKSCIYFDAYEHDYSDDPFVSFCTEIISLAETAFADSDAIQELKEDFKSKAKRVGGKLLYTGTRIGVKALTLGIIKDSDLDALDNIRGDVAESSSAAISNLVGKAFDDYANSKDSLAGFKEKLSKLGTAVRAAQEFPLLLIVDELDRCRPDFALSLIERIKHLFSTKNVCFMLLVNLMQLENYVKAVYGAEVDARNYLHKFFTIATDLPRNRQNSHENDCSRYTIRLTQHYGLESRDVATILSALFQFYNFSLREMERCFSILALYFSQLPENRLTNSEVVAFLSVIRLRFPEIFSLLATGRLSYHKLLESTGIDNINKTEYSRFSKDWFINILKFLLLSDEEYNELVDNDRARGFQDWLVRYHIAREKVMPFLCSELTRFKVGNS